MRKALKKYRCIIYRLKTKKVVSCRFQEKKTDPARTRLAMMLETKLTPIYRARFFNEVRKKEILDFQFVFEEYHDVKLLHTFTE